MAEILALPGNPSSVHGEGRSARRVLEEARGRIAAAMGVGPDGVTFTSGGTEANDLALGIAAGKPVLVSAIEHASVLEAAAEAMRAPVDQAGRIDRAALVRLLDQVRPALVSVMLVNNETGVVQDVAALAALVHGAGALLHIDAVQAFGKLPDVNLPALGCDLLTLSAHKIGGPAGVGALVARDELHVPARLRGGGQEGRRRAGTHNLAGIAGFAAAVELLDPAEPDRLAALRARLEALVLDACPAARIAGAGARRAPHIVSLVTPGRSAELQVIRLDLDGIAVSAGAACSSGKVAASHVLAAMGMGADAACAIRVSLGWTTRSGDIDRFVQSFARLHKAGTNIYDRQPSPLPNPSPVAT